MRRFIAQNTQISWLDVFGLEPNFNEHIGFIVPQAFWIKDSPGLITVEGWNF